MLGRYIYSRNISLPLWLRLLLTIVMTLLGLLLARLLSVFRRSGHGPLTTVPFVRILHTVLVLAYIDGIAKSVLRDLGSPCGFRLFAVQPISRRLSILLISMKPMVLTPFWFAVRADSTGSARCAASARLRPRVLVRIPLVIVVHGISGAGASVSMAERAVEGYVAPSWTEQVISEFWMSSGQLIQVSANVAAFTKCFAVERESTERTVQIDWVSEFGCFVHDDRRVHFLDSLIRVHLLGFNRTLARG